jgi:hypothetical protein
LISRADFVFTIGYEGNTAVVDGAMKRRHGSLSTGELAELGLYKQALCAAVYDEAAAAGGRASSRKSGGQERPTTEVLEEILEIYNRHQEHKLGSVEDLKRLFGVFEVPAGIGKVLVI